MTYNLNNNYYVFDNLINYINISKQTYEKYRIQMIAEQISSHLVYGRDGKWGIQGGNEFLLDIIAKEEVRKIKEAVAVRKVVNGIYE